MKHPSFSDAADFSLSRFEVKFDVALIACVLQHFRHPLDVLYVVAELADTVIVTEPVVARVEAAGMAELVPGPSNDNVGSWWLLPSEMVDRILQTALFKRDSQSTQTYRRWALQSDRDETDGFTDREFYTAVFRRKRGPA